MGRRRSGDLDALMRLPWWVAVVVGALGYVFIAYLLPYLLQKTHPVLSRTGEGLQLVGLLFFGICLLYAAISAIRQLLIRRSGRPD